MKKKPFVYAFMTLSLLLTGCGGNKNEGGDTPSPTPSIPTSKLEKVKYAFKGVDTSFQKYSGGNRFNRAYEAEDAGGQASKIDDDPGALDTILSTFTDQDIRGHSIEGLSYDQPPMIQFRYLNAVLDKVGDNYSLGTKYYYDITGVIYFDLNTGEILDGKEENKVNYSFGLSINIDIDDTDFITADVSFDINLSKGAETRHTVWYIHMDLDYDMNSASPTYMMRMKTDNDEHELTYMREPYVIEYDYVEVVNNNIKEWRKFCVSSSARLYKDATHPDGYSYLDDGTEIRIDAWSWFINDTFYKAKSMSKDRARLLFETFFTGLKMNSTDINAQAFIEKTATENSALKECYNDFSRIYGMDIIYNLIYNKD